MINWVKGVLGGFAGSVERHVLDVIHYIAKGIISVFGTVFHLVGAAWDDVGGAALQLADWGFEFARNVYRKLRYVILVLVPRLYHWIAHEIGRAIKLAEHIGSVLAKAINSLEAWAVREFNSVRRWAVTHLYNPLLRSLTSAWHWIGHEGASVWFYISHPDKLAAYLFWHIVDFLEANAEAAARRLGKFAVSLLLHNARKVATVAEDIIHSVL